MLSTDISLRIGSGQTVVFVGPSGGGKTTVSRLAARFWDINKGRITIGGMDVSKIGPEALICGGILTGIWMWSDMTLLLLFPPLFVCTVFLISPQYLFLTVHISIFFFVYTFRLAFSSPFLLSHLSFIFPSRTGGLLPLINAPNIQPPV